MRTAANGVPEVAAGRVLRIVATKAAKEAAIVANVIAMTTIKVASRTAIMDMATRPTTSILRRKATMIATIEVMMNTIRI